MNPISCPHCNQLNPESQHTCERCGESLLWSTVRKRNPKAWEGWARVLGYGALGVVLGWVATHRQAPAPPNQGPKPVPLSVSGAPRIDVVFALDTTGSMSDELDVVKTKVSKMMDEIQAGTPRPEVRMGLVAYRDHSDAYVTKTYPLTARVSAIQESLQELSAGGGGDTPEAVAEGLRAAVHEQNWDRDPNTIRMIFLIGDAGAHAHDDIRSVAREARERGIKINTWGCSGLQNFGQGDFEEIALLAGGEFQFLTYQQQVQRGDGSRARLIYQGSKAYEVSEAEDWSAGADKVASKREVEAAAVEAPGSSGAAVFKSSRYVPMGATMENNMDTALVRQVQSEASKQGVRY